MTLTQNPDIECVVRSADILGEVPLWCDRTRKLWWVHVRRPAAVQPYVRDGRIKALVIYTLSARPGCRPHRVRPAAPDDVRLVQRHGARRRARGGQDEVGAEPAQGQSFTPEVAQKLADAGLSEPMNTADFNAKLAAEFERWIPFLRKAGIKAE